MIARYLVFAFEGHYPNGGWDDLAGVADTIEDAKSVLAQALDNESNRAVYDAMPGEPAPRGLNWSRFYALTDGYIIDTATGLKVAA